MDSLRDDSVKYTSFFPWVISLIFILLKFPLHHNTYHLSIITLRLRLTKHCSAIYSKILYFGDNDLWLPQFRSGSKHSNNRSERFSDSKKNWILFFWEDILEKRINVSWKLDLKIKVVFFVYFFRLCFNN